MDPLNLLEERVPSKTLSIVVVILGIFSTLFSITASHVLKHLLIFPPRMVDLYTGLGLIGTSIILNLITGVLQALLLFSWNKAIRNNIENTKILFQFSKEKVSDNRKESLELFLIKLSQLDIATWAFWIYLTIYVMTWMLGMGMRLILNVVSFIFLAIYLQSLFSISSELSKLKRTAYSLFLKTPAPLPEIKPRNIIMVAFLAIVTFTLYWLYLIIKLTYEIANFIESDKSLRESVISALKGEQK